MRQKGETGPGRVGRATFRAGIETNHILRVEDLLGELGHSQGAVLLAAATREGRVPDHEEVQPGDCAAAAKI